MIAPPRTGKSGALADRLLDHPGPAIVTSTRADLYHLTAKALGRSAGRCTCSTRSMSADCRPAFSWNLLDPWRGPWSRPAGWRRG